MPRISCVNADVFSFCFDPADVVCAQQDRAVADFDGHVSQMALLLDLERTHQRSYRAHVSSAFASAELLDGAVDRLEDSLLVERLQYIVDRRDLECLNRV